VRTESLIVAAATFCIAFLLTAWVRRHALARGQMDIPNTRSSHVTPTPRGGGLAIVVTATAAFLALAATGLLPARVAIALAGGGVAVAAVGYVDDRLQTSAAVRLVVHLAAAVWGLAWLGGLPPLSFGGVPLSLGWAGQLLGVLGIVWMLNLFNFMDGLDGIAASEGAFIGWGGALLATVSAIGPSVAAASAAFGAACLGFLVWNWPPARIFMGDVGSGYLGFTLAILALAASAERPVAFWVWLILGGVFIVDATATLIRRSFRGDRVYEAHCSHAYQWLARRWGSHLQVTLSVLAVNVLWLLPCAWLAVSHARSADLICVAALLPLVVIAIVAGAGKREIPSRE
jgi:Fuc2NAc and GlcNAc transferase